MRAAVLIVTCALTACAGPVHPTYDFETGYLGPGVASPQALDSELRDYASLACGGRRYRVLDQVFVGETGPSYARFRFICP